VRAAWSGWHPRWRVAAFLPIAGALNYADRAAFSAVLEPLRSELNLSNVTLGLLSSLFLWSYALGSPFAGMMADRWKRGRVVIMSLIAWSVVTGLTGFATNVWQLAAMRIVLGLSECFFLPAAFSLLADHHGNQTRARAMSALSIGDSLGIVIGGAVAGHLAEHYGWRYGFWILGGAGILVATVAGAFVSEAPKSSPRTGSAAIGETLRYLARVPTYHVLLAKTMLAGFAVWIFLSWLPLYFRETYGLGLGAAGFVGTFMIQIAGMLGTATGGWWSDAAAAKEPRGRLLVLVVCYAAVSPVLLLFLTQPVLLGAVAIVSISSLLRGAGDATEKPALCEVVPACYRATAIGLANALATAAGGVGVFITGWLKGEVGLNGIFAGCSVVFFAATALLFLGYRYWMERDIARARSITSAAGGNLGRSPMVPLVNAVESART
jgi:predicted MFS family arabinose efflux permease